MYNKSQGLVLLYDDANPTATVDKQKAAAIQLGGEHQRAAISYTAPIFFLSIYCKRRVHKVYYCYTSLALRQTFLRKAVECICDDAICWCHGAFLAAACARNEKKQTICESRLHSLNTLLNPSVLIEREISSSTCFAPHESYLHSVWLINLELF
jgi:hypothetical protein